MFNITLDDPLIQGLACASIQPGLRSILIFDAPYVGLRELAAILREMIATVTQQNVTQASLGPSEQENDLWGYLPFPNNQGRPLSHIPLLFSQTRHDQELQLITIPDLTLLSIAAARACTMLIDADIAHLERNNYSEQWQPDYYWLASCPSKRAGAVSPHLLDRFALRLTWPTLIDEDVSMRVANLFAYMHDPSPHFPDAPSLPDALREQVQAASLHDAKFTRDALPCIVGYTPDELYYPRRDLALARLAQAFARLFGDDNVTTKHVEEAANLIGLGVLPPPSGEEIPLVPELPTEDEASNHEPRVLHPSNVDGSGLDLAPTPTESIDEMLPEYPAEQFGEVEPSQAPRDPYPEDTARVERDIAPLRFAYTLSSSVRSDKGPIIGIEQTDTLQDLSMVGTIMAASLFRAFRQRPDPQQKKYGLVIKRSDLRRHRRGPVTKQMLLLLMDYTSLARCNWQDALLPHLIWAYTGRASISIVKVGGIDAQHYLQAELVTARNLLSKNIEVAFDVMPGGATPLAHGFDLALQRLRHVLQHGRSTIQKARFVVLSDGRGNVPLEASRSLQLSEPVTREGIKDTFVVANMIAALKDVEIFLLNPQSRYYTKLPAKLAETLKAELIPIKRLDIVEV